MRPYLHPEAHASVSKAILITGPARSGTSIVGTLVHSFEHVEYVFEPPLLYGLFPLIDSMPEDQWKYLYECYLYYDFLLDSLAGRRLNLNNNDISSFYQAKGEDEVLRRHRQTWHIRDTMHISSEYRIAYKMPDLVPYLPTLLRYYPDMKVILMQRSFDGLSESIKKMGWFSDKGLESNVANWPMKNEAGPAVPFWVSDGREQEWLANGERWRIALYTDIMNTSVNKSLECQVIQVSYDSFLINPKMLAEALAEELGLQFGSITEHVLSYVQSPHPETVRGDKSIALA